MNALVNLAKPESKQCREMIARYLTLQSWILHLAQNQAESRRTLHTPCVYNIRLITGHSYGERVIYLPIPTHLSALL